MDRLERTKEILARLIGFPTVSTESNLDLIAWVANYLEGLGARVEVMADESGRKANLFATLGPEGDGGIMLSGHTDVVPVTDQDWTTDPWQMRAADGHLFGRGTCDMKGFIAATLAVAPDFAAADLRRPLHFAFTHDEEIGCFGAQSLVERLAGRGLRPAMAIIGEPTEMRIIEGHKGCYEYTTRFTGAEGHASAPDRGVNAAEYAARYVGRLLDIAETMRARAPAESRFDPPWTTLSVGRLSGGHARNVIAGKAEVEWEMRPVQPADADAARRDILAYAEQVLLPAMQAVDPDACIETEVVAEVDGLVPMEDNAARDLVAELTGANTTDVVAFCTEGGLFQALGTNVVVCGPGSIEQAHKPDEFLSEDQLAACLDMLAGMGRKLT